ncbi:S8 family serine peptidase [Bacillus benzoevorans]|uniref:Minor extracellular serine protease Vpr n=1 Tax=Bacillus benzoevorans TaxID=1456 RepID=A0A7X0LX22_9BACI|nr:S8 family serine peptidase [Bacillus benzoevorans]MBB6447175.1 minor extracellular serine protease Vpr [Bacillus benzoevorans]
MKRIIHFVLLLILSSLFTGVDHVPLDAIPMNRVSAGTVQISDAARMQTAAAAIPPLPKPDSREEQIAIAITDKNVTAAEVQQIMQKYPNISVRKIFSHALNGFSVQGPAASLQRLAQNEAVNTVTIVNQYGTVQPPATPASPVAAGSFITNQYQNHAADNMELIGATEARGILNRKWTGKGVKIGVIDTGVDYSHADLKNNYRGGHDVVDGDVDPMETRGVFGQETLHGTHVAGIIAANGQMKGVAPEASIYAYRALGPGGAGTSEQIIAAIEQAIRDKVDIINLSLGTNINGPDLPLSLALDKAVEQGITAVTSSGNSGPNIWTVGTPGTASKAISVGASTPTLKIPYIMDREGERIKLEPMQGSISWDLNREYELIDGGIGRMDELKDSRGKIVLMERGSLTFSEKVKNAADAGAVAAIIYNNTKGPLLGNLEQVSPIPIMGISKKEGKRLLKEIEEGDAHINTIVMEERDELAEFSSRGPVTSSWEIKPDVLAPGVAIQSTVPGGYIPLAGTSMASPHVAGAAALIKEAHPDWDPEKIKAALMNYAQPLRNKEGELYRTYEQGAGRIRLQEALEADVLAYPASLQFGRFQTSDIQHVHSAKMTIENLSGEEKSFSITGPKQKSGLLWRIPLPFTLQAGEKKTVEIQLSADPLRLKEKIQDGAFIIHTGGRDIRIPYLFVLEEPDYPRVMGFDFGAGDRPGTYRYEVYLPGGADEFGIALFEPDTHRFIQFLDWKRNVAKGLLEQELHSEQMPDEGFYLVKVFARKSGKEDMLDTFLSYYIHS